MADNDLGKIDMEDWELKVSFLDRDGQSLPTNVMVVSLDELFNKPALWSFVSERISGVCLYLRNKKIGGEDETMKRELGI